MKKYLLLTYVIVLTAIFAFITVKKEKLFKSKQTVYLELAPVDPRSLMQGDYMQLNYALEQKAQNFVQSKFAVVTVTGYIDNRLVLVGLDLEKPHFKTKKIRLTSKGKKLKAVKVRLQMRGGTLKIGANSFFFEEGQAKLFEKSKFGIYKLAKNGELLLYGMANVDLLQLKKLQK